MVQVLSKEELLARFDARGRLDGLQLMPEMLRWLWRDYPRPDDPKDETNRKLLVPGEATPPGAAPAAPK